MRVYIGKYPNYISLYSITDLILRTEPLKEKYEERFIEFLEKIGLGKIFDLVRSKRLRKIKIHIDSYDVWNMDHTLALIILPMLKKLKEEKNGVPLVDNDDVPPELFSEDTFNDDVEKLIPRWDYVLDQMIEEFERVLDDTWDEQFYKDGKFDAEAYNDAMEKSKNAMRLFGKYYNALWT